METTFLEVCLKNCFLLHCVPLYVCRLCINFQDLCARLLGMAALRILLLTFISPFVIDFLSIRKVIIFSAITTDDRHPLRSRSIHQNAANCMTIRFRYIAQPGGGGGHEKPTAHAHILMFDALPVGRTACRVRVFEDVRHCRNCSKARPNVSR